MPNPEPKVYACGCLRRNGIGPAVRNRVSASHELHTAAGQRFRLTFPQSLRAGIPRRPAVSDLLNSKPIQRACLKRNEVRFVGMHGRFRIYSFIWITHCQKQVAQRRAPGAPLRIHSRAVSHGAGWVSEWRTTLRASFSILGQAGIQMPRFTVHVLNSRGQFCKPVSFRNRAIQIPYMKNQIRRSGGRACRSDACLPLPRCRRLLATRLCLALTPSLSRAFDAANGSARGLAELSLEELMNESVTSVLKKETSPNESSAATGSPTFNQERPTT